MAAGLFAGWYTANVEVIHKDDQRTRYSITVYVSHGRTLNRWNNVIKTG